MIKKTITYTDYNGNERTETFLFNLTKAEVAKMQMSTAGGLDVRLNSIVEAQDMPAIIAVFEDLIQRSYGIKTPDGRGFMKSQSALDEFMASPAYSELFMELATNAEAAVAFVNGILPENMGKNLPANK